jgi:hypothetical protein
MARTAELRVAIDPGVLAALRAMADAAGRPPAKIVEDALRLTLDPLSALKSARDTVASYRTLLQAFETRQSATEDDIRVIADFVCDAMRASTQAALGQQG